MTIPRWDDFPKTGFVAQDEEHEQIKAHLGGVLDALNGRRASSAQVSTALTVTLDQFIAHFEHEQALMRPIHDPSLERHAEAHALFLADVQRHLFMLQATGLTSQVRTWTAGRFVHWFRLHIFRYDIGLGLLLMDNEDGTGDPYPDIKSVVVPTPDRVLSVPNLIQPVENRRRRDRAPLPRV